MSDQFLPFHVPQIDEEEICSVVETLKSGWLTTGVKVKRFEEDFVEFLAVREQGRHFTQAAERLSEEAFRAVWDNSDDAEYDRL